MVEIKIKLKKKPHFPLELDTITPNNFVGKTAAEIKKLEIYHGKDITKFGDFFDVTGKSTELNDTTLVIEGDLSKAKRIGEGMKGGEIIINSDVGMHVGNKMKGGKITVNGNADDWAGAMMEGGELVINGDAGNYIGSAYRGFWQGMKNGIIRVKGNVGNESMLWAKSSKPSNKWPTLYCGSAGAFLGIHNHGGTIVVEGNVDRCAGADQALGTIVIKGKISRLLPSYKKIGEVDEVTLPNGEKVVGKFIEYSGDHSVSKESNGRIYLAA
jgi:formylmethanofuran dehydrogenase subunit C